MLTTDLLSQLKCLSAMYDELEIAQAAAKIGVTRTAMREALANLSRIAQDDLFISTARGTLPTSRTEAMITHVRAVLAEAEAISKPEGDWSSSAP